MEWVPAYREAFYTNLIPQLDSCGIDVRVIHGAPPASRRSRNDSVQPAWATFRPNRELRIRGNEVTWQPVFRESRDADLVIVQNEAALPFTYLALAHRKLGGPRVAMWGHGAHFNESEANPAAEAVKKRLAPLVDWFFAYTERSAEIVRSHGLPGDRITVVNNSRESDAVTLAVEPEPELADLVRTVSLRSSHVGWMVSALDEWKRLPFLVQTLDEVRRKIPDFEFFVIGQGDSTTIADAAETRPWLHGLGSRFSADKAAVGALADITIQPGLIGLHAIDAFAFRTPMVTTEHPFHSHEFEYLKNGYNSVVLPEETSARALGTAVADLFRDPTHLEHLKVGCASSASDYSLESMVERFAAGIQQALDAPR